MGRAFFIVLVTELFLGGGGRLTEVGSATLRMLLFSVALLAAVVLGMHRRRVANMPLALGLVGIFLAIHAIGVVRGALAGADSADIFTDLRPLLYWMIAPFFAVALTSSERIRDAALCAEASGLAMAMAFLATVAALFAGQLDFAVLYERLDSTDEFNFRGEHAFFYKGFLYLCIALVLALARRSRWRFAAALLLATAIVLTLTRGFILASTIAALALLVSVRDVKPVTAGIAVMLGATILYLLISDGAAFSLAREESDTVRLDDLSYFQKEVDMSILLFGSGLGTPFNGRLNIENSYLWIVWKIGLPGLVFWVLPMIFAADAYRRVPRSSPQYRFASGLFFCVVLIYVQTATNPYLNNPIGLSFVLLAVFGLREIAAAPPARATQPRPWRTRPTSERKADASAG